MSTASEAEVYSAFADIYDEVMRDVDYESWAEHAITLSKRVREECRTVLDVACGTGTLAIELARRGYTVTGVDRSQQMLKRAEQKAHEQDLAVSFAQASMERMKSFRTKETFDLVTCLYDSLNYVLEEDSVADFFQQINGVLNPGGVLIFDVTTEYNLLHNFAGYTFAENFDTASYIWENEYDILSKICTSKVTMFYRKHSAYHKQVEYHRQKVFTNDSLKRMLREAGFEVHGLFHNMTELPPKQKCERIHFVCLRT